MADVNLVLRVVDSVTKETRRIIGRMVDMLKFAADATKRFFSNFSAGAIGAVVGGIKKIGEAFAWVGQKMNEFAPNAKQYTAQFSITEMMRLKEGAESFNKLGAAWDRFVGSLLSKGSVLTRFFDDITRRLKQVTNEVALTPVAAAQLRLAEAEARIGTGIGGVPLTEAQKKSPYYQGFIENQKKELEAAKKLYEFEKQRYDLERKRIQQFKDESEAEAQAKVNEELAKANAELERFYRAFLKMEDEMLMEEFQYAWESAGRAIEWTNQQLEKQERRNESVAESLRGLADTLREIGSYETQEFIQAWNEMWDEIDARERESNEASAANTRARLDKMFADHEANMAAISALDKERMDKAEEEILRLRASLDRVADIMTDRIMGAFDAIIAGTESVGRAFARMIAGILADIGRMMAAEAMKKWITTVLGSLFSAGANTLSAQNGGAFDDFGGEISPLYDLPQASGGFVGGRNAFMVGERGPELFVPTTAGNIITAGRTAQMGGGGIGNVSITVNGAQDPIRTATEVKRALLGLLANDVGTRQRLRVVASGGGVA